MCSAPGLARSGCVDACDGCSFASMVETRSRRVAEGACDELCAIGHDIRGGRRSASDRSSQAEPGKLPYADERRRARASLNGGGLPTFPLLDDVSLGVDRRRSKPRERSLGGATGPRSWGAIALKHALQETFCKNIDPKADSCASRTAHVSADMRLSAVRTLADLDDGSFRRRSATMSVRPIDALLGFRSSAAAQSRPARFSR